MNESPSVEVSAPAGWRPTADAVEALADLLLDVAARRAEARRRRGGQGFAFCRACGQPFCPDTEGQKECSPGCAEAARRTGDQAGRPEGPKDLSA